MKTEQELKLLKKLSLPPPPPHQQDVGLRKKELYQMNRKQRKLRVTWSHISWMIFFTIFLGLKTCWCQNISDSKAGPTKAGQFAHPASVRKSTQVCTMYIRRGPSSSISKSALRHYQSCCNCSSITGSTPSSTKLCFTPSWAGNVTRLNWYSNWPLTTDHCSVLSD